MEETKPTIDVSADLCIVLQRLSKVFLQKEDPVSVAPVTLPPSAAMNKSVVCSGLGFDWGYMECRYGGALRWSDMAIVYYAYAAFEENLKKETPTAWGKWDKSFLNTDAIAHACNRVMPRSINESEKDAFRQGWCEGVSKFFMVTSHLIVSEAREETS